MNTIFELRWIAAAVTLTAPTLASAQDEQPALAAEESSEQATKGARVFEPAYFAQFAPRNALDMVEQLPGFQISGGGGGGGRGLGQASDNVIVNGARLTSKSDSVSDQLRRIPADKVRRIELVEGATLDVPGLVGLVANVIVEAGGLSGQFIWEGALRTTEVDPEWYGGEVSISGTTGNLGFTLAIENNNNRFGSTGPTVFRDADGNVIERQETIFTGAFDEPRVSGALRYDFGGGTTANVNAFLARTYFDRLEDELRFFPDDSVITRFNARDGGAPEYEISADLTFPLGPGRLKLIGLEAWDGDVSSATVIDTPDDGSLAVGSRFASEGGSGERIGRFEYNWPMLGGEWQLAGEAAFNRLERVSGLFTLDDQGDFIEIPFPGGSGGVKEDRYEGVLTFTRPLTDRLVLQASVGGEYSNIRQTGFGANSRSFQRPKGTASLAWQPEEGLDISLAAERRVGQLDFGDFLASVALDQDNENAGNNELVPSQTWEITLEVAKVLGNWGSTTLMVEQRWIEDYVDLIPLAGGGEANGNIDKARRTEIEWSTTLRLDNIGWKGAQLDVRLEYEEGEVADPVTGLLRDFSGRADREAEIDLRHDIPGSDFAWGGGFQYNRIRPRFRLSEVSREWEGPVLVSAFIEHKDIFGLTVNLSASNIFGGRERFFRTVYDGPRDQGIVLFTEDRNLRIGPIFRFNVAGSF
ncbi:TonB-dependent receptor plug domain-containing protein [Qipengyuania xiapuensis]|uniref:TonB-dependent receptor plug domain-containing protein n=1 Tax=Qipengyuania xiapuensis TaxID=2867236 RepID=A0ABX9A116_9SPHN|nr:TonB-dependent receptor plug domain-containing protein [Qipengyuania xiapuensis]